MTSQPYQCKHELNGIHLFIMISTYSFVPQILSDEKTCISDTVKAIR